MSDWIGWSGGECPVDDEALVFIEFNDGSRSSHPVRAGRFKWGDIGFPCDIAAYRLADETPEDFGQQNQVKYKRDGKDLIDRWHERYSIEEFRVLMWAMMEKYNERLGKKDDIAQEVQKIADYAQRWAEKEGLE